MRFIYLCIWLLLAGTPHDRSNIRTSIFICSSFPCLLHSFDVFKLLSVESSQIILFTFEIWFRFFHPWCPFVWVIFCSAHERRRTFEQSFYSLIYVSLYFLRYLSFWEILTLKPFVFNLWHGIILNTIHLSILLPFHGSFAASFLGHILMWSGWIPKIVFKTSPTSVI